MAFDIPFRSLVVKPESCTGCRICELACSFRHYRRFNPRRARIHVISNQREGLYVPIVCHQCEVALCLESCPVKAIYRASDGRVLVDQEKCIGCRTCLTACPFGAMFWDFSARKAIKCDLCDGDPYCVKYCPREALLYVPESTQVVELRREYLANVPKLLGLISGGTDDG